MRRGFYLILGVLALVAFQNCSQPRPLSFNQTSTAISPIGTTSGTAPADPSQLNATAVSATQINLTWIDNSNNETGFRVERSGSGGPFSGPTGFSQIATVAANVTSYSDTGLMANTSYTYRVSAVNGIGTSAPTSEISASTMAPPTSTPAAPSGLTATAASATTVNLNWVDNSNNETDFLVERSANNGTSFTQIATVGADNHIYQDVNLTPSTTYVYRVRAANSAGNSAYSANASVTTSAANNMATYTYISANILQTNCVGCHSGANPPKGVNLATYANVVKEVTAGKATSSTLYTIILSGSMPPGGPLTATQISAIRDWINAGAANN